MSDPSGSRTGERAVEVLPVIGANEPNRWTHLGLDQPQRLSGPGFDHIVECAEEQADWEADDE